MSEEKTYIMVLDQEVDDPGYYIGRGITITTLSATRAEDVVKEVLEDEWLVGAYRGDWELCPKSVTVYEVTDILNLHKPITLQQALDRAERQREKKAEQEQTDRAEYEKLKKRFGDE